MSKAYKRKTKAQRQQWWSLLTPREKEKYIEYKQETKAKRRKFRPITNKYPKIVIFVINSIVGYIYKIVIE